MLPLCAMDTCHGHHLKIDTSTFRARTHTSSVKKKIDLSGCFMKPSETRIVRCHATSDSGLRLIGLRYVSRFVSQDRVGCYVTKLPV